MTLLNDDCADIQALAYTGFDSLASASYFLLRVTDQTAARRFLGAVKVASVDDLGTRQSEAIQVAITAAGFASFAVFGLFTSLAPAFIGGT